jgi:hypothetical protein
MRKFIILLIIGVFFASCKKKRTIFISAKNAATGEGYAGLGFVLKETKGYVTSTGEVQKKVYEGTLNAQGEAAFDYKLKNNRSYVITTLVPDEELCYINNTSYTLSNLDDNYKFEFLFAGCAYRILKINNVNCQGPNDLFDMDMKLLYDMEYIAFGLPEKSGCYSNEFSNEKVPAGKWLVEWWVNRSGNTDYFTDTVEHIENQLFVYEINY